MTLHLCWLYLLIIQLMNFIQIKECSFQYRQPTKVARSLPNETPDQSQNSNYILSESTSKGNLKNPIRILYKYSDNFENFYFAKKYKKTYILPAKLELENTIGIKYRLKGPLLLPRNCQSLIKVENRIQCHARCPLLTCGSVTFPEDTYGACYNDNGGSIINYKAGKGIPDTDLVIVIDSADNCPTAQLAFSTVCGTGYKDRPIVGSITFCKSMPLDITSNPRRNIDLVKHEILHILAFQETTYVDFLDENGKYLIKRNEIYVAADKDAYQGGILKRVNRSRESVEMKYQKTFSSFLLPKTLNYARKHFNCLTLDGVDMEDVDTSASHFDELLYSSELMTPIQEAFNNKMSGLTLSFLDDSGWYFVDYSKAQHFNYAANLGCDFVLNGCYTYMKIKKNQDIYPYCNIPSLISPYKYKCSKDHTYYETCDLKRTYNKDPKYIYFSSLLYVSDLAAKEYGGLIRQKEYCPILEKIEIDSTTSLCIDIFNKNNSDTTRTIKDYYGADSICLNTEIRSNGITDEYSSSCFKCFNRSSNSIYFYYNNVLLKCSNKKPATIDLTVSTVLISCINLSKNDKLPMKSDKKTMRYSMIILMNYMFTVIVTINFFDF